MRQEKGTPRELAEEFSLGETVPLDVLVVAAALDEVEPEPGGALERRVDERAELGRVEVHAEDAAQQLADGAADDRGLFDRVVRG